MAAKIEKNELTDSLRQCDLIIYQDGALTLAPRGTDFIALGIVYVPDPASIPHYKAAAGTMVNKRRPLVVADDVVESVDTGADTLELTAHAYETGDGPFDADGNLGTLLSGNSFYVIAVDANNIAVANTLADAYADTRVALGGTETGSTISDRATTQRGLDGIFVYTWTQAETDVDLTELSVLVEGTGYSRANSGGAYTTANLGRARAKGFDDQMENDGTSYGNGMRALYRGETQNYTRDGSGNYVHQKPDGNPSHSGTVNGAGRTNANTIDLDP